MAAGVPPPAGTRRAARRHGAATAAGRARPRAVVPQRMRRAAAVAVLLVVGAGGRGVAAQGDVDSLAARVHRLAGAYVAGYFQRQPHQATPDGVAGARPDRPPANPPVTPRARQAAA